MVDKRTRAYNSDFLRENMMGPNAMMLLEELTNNIDLRPGMKILDLGCGRGLTSIFLAKEFGVEVIAYDLWIAADDNEKRFKEMGLDHLITPMNGDANAMPFIDDYFDGVISVDAYHYFGSNLEFLPKNLLPLLKKNAILAIAVPGMKNETTNIPDEMKAYWDDESLKTWHTKDYWKTAFKAYLKDLSIMEMLCFDQAWRDWLSTDNHHAVGDRDMIKTDGGKYMNLIAITGRVMK